ncbi:NPCBM/NEW2 domain-containing protein [Parafrankia sp. FMc2]|uniref:NPCBM/NEW2 domain-containing protein n=1 Tax=Parafrankia sp. FMc2 TaxID=3233196 RepID=UPI0034D5AB8F
MVDDPARTATIRPSLMPPRTAAADPEPSSTPPPNGPQEIYLKEIKSLSGNPNYKTLPVNGIEYINSLYADVGQVCDPASRTFEYNIGKTYDWLRADIGISDNSADPNKRVEFAVYLDGVKVFNRQLGLNESFPLNVPVTNVLRLKLEQTYITAKGCTQGYNVWGSVRLVVDP